MSEEKTVYERLDDIEKGQEIILKALKDSNQSRTNNVNNQQTSPQVILHNFIKSAVQKFHWLGDESEFRKNKNTIKIILCIAMLFMIATTIVASICFKIYSTFTFFENIWFICTALLLKNIFKSQRKYLATEYEDNSFCYFSKDGNGIIRINTYKKKYKVLFILCLISIVLNIIFSWIQIKGVGAVVTTIFELVTGIMIIISVYKASYFFAGYNFISFTGKNGSGNVVKIYYEPIVNKWSAQEEFEKMFPMVK